MYSSCSNRIMKQLQWSFFASKRLVFINLLATLHLIEVHKKKLHFISEPLPVNEPNQCSKSFLIQPHGKSFQRLNILHCSGFGLSLWGVVGRTGGSQFSFRLTLATHSHGELIDNRRGKDDLGYVLLSGAEDCRSSLDCCWVGKVRLVVCTFMQINND